MRNDTYIFNGVNYKATRKDVAQKAIQENPTRKYFLVGDKVSQAHFHAGWHIASHPQTINDILEDRKGMETDIPKCIQNQYNSFNYYLDPELGKYPLYYVQVI